MFKNIIISCALVLPLSNFSVLAQEDTRQMVELPDMMRTHMLGNMRNHLVTLDKILEYLAADELEKAADIAEANLGFSSLELHGASHIAKYMPEAMSAAGTAMHKAASQFARIAQEGEALPAYAKLKDVTAACVACHAGYKVQ